MIDVARVEVSHFLFGNIFALVAGDLCHFGLVGNTAAFGNSCGLFQQRGGWWTLGDKVETAIVIDRDDDGNRGPVGTSLGKFGVNLGQFVQAFNDRTKEIQRDPDSRHRHGL